MKREASPQLTRGKPQTVKAKMILLGSMLAALVSSAQTKSIIFPQLLSPTNSVLMTNAEFRCYSGSNIFFRNGNGYHLFHAADLNTNVLSALHITVAQLEAQQQKLDAAKQQYKAQANAQPPAWNIGVGVAAKKPCPT